MAFVNSTWSYMTHPKRIIYDLIAKYGSDKGTLTFKRGTNSLQTGQTPGNDIVQTFSPAITPGEDVFTIATSEKRAYISEIIVETSSGTPQPTV